MNCPFCKKQSIYNSICNWYRCMDNDHDFFFNASYNNDWYLYHNSSRITIKKTVVIYKNNIDSYKFKDPISPEQGNDYLVKYLKLKAFI